jgi:hypothetical protein
VHASTCIICCHHSLHLLLPVSHAATGTTGKKESCQARSSNPQGAWCHRWRCIVPQAGPDCYTCPHCL